MTRRTELPPELAGRAFAVREARDAAVPWRRLDASDLQAPFRGARAPAGRPHIEALAALLTPDQAFTGPTAALLWGMPLPRRFREQPELWVSSLSRDRTVRREGVVSRRRSTGPVLRRRGLPVLDPARTWASLTGVLQLHDLVAVADHIVTSSPGSPALATLDDLVRIAEAPGQRNVRLLRAALRESRRGAWSRPETLLRLAITRVGIPEPRLNEEVPLGGGRGAAPDLGWPELRVGVEYDGVWHDDPLQRRKDLERHELLVDAGWLLARVRAADLFPHPLPAVARVLRRLTERGYRHPSAIERAALPSWEP